MLSYYAEFRILFSIKLNVVYAYFCYAECRSAECRSAINVAIASARNAKGGSIIVSFWFGYCLTADSKPVKQEINGTVILPPLVFPGFSLYTQYICNI